MRKLKDPCERLWEEEEGSAQPGEGNLHTNGDRTASRESRRSGVEDD